MLDRKKRAIKPDVDPLAWAKALCARRVPTPTQADLLANVRDAAVVMITTIIQSAKPSTDRTAAVRKVREALKIAEDAVLLDWEDL